jgi:hypothetical protein
MVRSRNQLETNRYSHASIPLWRPSNLVGLRKKVNSYLQLAVRREFEHFGPGVNGTRLLSRNSITFWNGDRHMTSGGRSSAI